MTLINILLLEIYYMNFVITTHRFIPALLEAFDHRTSLL
jgi:hypothetical protein